jgi:hypothetical protein
MSFVKKRRNLKLGKKAFVTDIIVDFWSYIVFVLVVIVFAVLFKLSSEAMLQALEGAKDVTYGNYLAQVYLRTPVIIGNTEMTMAELIAMYDYNQSLIRPEDRTEDYIFTGQAVFALGQPNAMKDAIMSITNDFVENNYNEHKCFVFSIHGKAFDYTKRNTRCFGSETFGMYYLWAQIPLIPNETYVTYIAPVDPREDPIAIYSISDLEGLLSVYSDDPYFNLDELGKAGRLMTCRASQLGQLVHSAYCAPG